MDLARLALLGRWSHQQTLRIYVNDGWLELQEMAISGKVLRHCKVLSRKLEVLLVKAATLSVPVWGVWIQRRPGSSFS